MALSPETTGDATIVRATGELDVSTVPDLRRCLYDVVAEGARHIVLDLSEVTFIDSTTLGVLVSVRNRLQPARGRLDLVAQHPAVLTVLRMTALDRVFTVHSSLAEVTPRSPTEPSAP